MLLPSLTTTVLLPSEERFSSVVLPGGWFPFLLEGKASTFKIPTIGFLRGTVGVELKLPGCDVEMRGNKVSDTEL